MPPVCAASLRRQKRQSEATDELDTAERLNLRDFQAGRSCDSLLHRQNVIATGSISRGSAKANTGKSLWLRAATGTRRRRAVQDDDRLDMLHRGNPSARSVGRIALLRANALISLEKFIEKSCQRARSKRAPVGNFGGGQASERDKQIAFHVCGGWGQYKIGKKSMATSKPLDPSSLPVGPFSRDLIDAKSDDGEKSGGLGDLLDQVSKGSVGEVDGLIGELRQLRAKLQADGDRIKRDIEQYETLSQQVMQLTKIISDSLATLSNVRRLVDGRTH